MREKVACLTPGFTERFMDSVPMGSNGLFAFASMKVDFRFGQRSAQTLDMDHSLMNFLAAPRDGNVSLKMMMV